MTAPQVEPARTDEPGPAPEPGQVDDQILGLAAAGVPLRKIAQQVGLSKSTVHDRLSARLRAERQRPAEEVIAMRAVRNEDLFRRAYAALVGAEKGSDAWGRAWDRCLRAEESARRLEGSNAPESLVITENRHLDEAGELTVSTLVAVLAGLGLDDARRKYALGLAAWEMHGREGDPPAPPADMPPADSAPALAGPYTSDGITYVVVKGVRYERAGVHRPADLPAIDGEVIEEAEDADANRAELLALEEGFADLLYEEDDDEPEDDQESAA